jgi:PhoH-like ATPase
MNNYTVLDTNVLMLNPNAISEFENVIIPLTVVEELDNHKKDADLVGYNSRKALKYIEENKIQISKECLLDYPDKNNDDLIIGCAKYHNATLVSNDYAVRAKARMQLSEDKVQEYKNNSNVELGELRTGEHEIAVSNEIIAKFHKEGVEISELNTTNTLYANEFVKLLDCYEGKIQAIGIIKGDRLEKCKNLECKPSDIKPLNLEQKMAIELLMDDDIEFVSLTGSSGVSKTFASLMTALHLIDEGKFNKLYIVKPPMSIDKTVSTGFKTGDHLDKMRLPLGSITSNLENSAKKKKGEVVNGFEILMGYIEMGTIEIISLEDILGMSLNPNSIMLVDEFETLDKSLAQAVLSRVGKDSKVIVTGDLKQHACNRLLAENTGLYHAINVFAGYEKAGHLQLKEVVRSGFVKKLVQVW